VSGAWRWFKDHAWLFVVVGVLLAIWIFSDKDGKKAALKQVEEERTVVREKAEIRKTIARKDTAVALKAVEEKYALKLSKLQVDQADKVKELEDDPEALVEFILRSAG
jgi:hypothetical protein